MASATRALMWKEWREQRPIVITGLGLALLLPPLLIAGAGVMRREVNLATLADAVPLTFVLVVWPLLAAACGAATVSNEIGDGTIGFLLSRPASRPRVWLIKVGTALLALLAIVAGSAVVTVAFRALVGGGSRGLALDPLLGLGSIDVAEAFVGVALAGCMLLLFACAAFFSTFLSRAMTAAAAGVVAALAIIAAVFLVWSRFDLIPRFEPGLVALELGAASVLVLLAALGVFSRGEMLGGRAALRPVLAASIAAPAALVLISVPVLLAHARLVPSGAVLHDPQLSIERRAVVATATGPEGESPQTWLIHLDGSGLERLSPRLTGIAALAPSGGRVAYLSRRGPLGMRSDTVALHVVNADGTGDRVVMPELPGNQDPLMPYGEIRFAPGGDRVALRFESWLAVVSPEGGPVVERDLSRDDLAGAMLVGWTQDGTEVLLVSSRWIDKGRTIVAAWNPRDDRLRPIWSVERERAWMPWESGQSAAVRWLPLALLDDGEGNENQRRSTLMLLDVRDGSTREIADRRCGWGVDVDAAAGRLAYTTCAGEPGETGLVRVHLRDLADDTDRIAGTFEGRAGRLALSPTGDAILVERFAEPGVPLGPVVVHRDGRVVELAAGWSPLGWAGRSEVVVARQARVGIRALAVADAGTGAMRGIFPDSRSGAELTE